MSKAESMYAIARELAYHCIGAYKTLHGSMDTTVLKHASNCMRACLSKDESMHAIVREQ